jgi:hypothetical protein
MNLHPRFPVITAAHVLRECARELEQRRNFYPRRIAEGRMMPDEADRQLAIAAAWLEDAGRIEASDYRPDPLAPATHGSSWGERRTALARELGLRARIFPQRVAEGRLTPADADHRRDCLAALAARMDDGFDWIASNGARPQWAAASTTPAIEQARAEWQEHCQRVDHERQAAVCAVAAGVI